MVSKACNNTVCDNTVCDNTVCDTNKIKHCGTVVVKWERRGGKAEKYLKILLLLEKKKRTLVSSRH